MPRLVRYAEEFNRLLVEQGTAIRSMKYGYRPDEAADQLIKDRAERLIELAQLMGEFEPENYVNARLASWIQANPVALTNGRLVDQVLETTYTANPDSGSSCGVSIVVGEGDRAYHYAVMADDLTVSRDRVIFRVPESVAEHFRQSGRRQLKRELAQLLGLKSDL